MTREEKAILLEDYLAENEDLAVRTYNTFGDGMENHIFAMSEFDSVFSDRSRLWVAQLVAYSYAAFDPNCDDYFTVRHEWLPGNTDNWKLFSFNDATGSYSPYCADIIIEAALDGDEDFGDPGIREILDEGKE